MTTGRTRYGQRQPPRMFGQCGPGTTTTRQPWLWPLTTPQPVSLAKLNIGEPPQVNCRPAAVDIDDSREGTPDGARGAISEVIAGLRPSRQAVAHGGPL